MAKQQDERHVGVPEFTTPDHATYRDGTLVVRWGGRNFPHPVPLIAMEDLHPGDLIWSSGGYNLLVKRTLRRETGDPDQHTFLEGYLHGQKVGGHTRTENYPSKSTVPLLARGGVVFGESAEVPLVPITAAEAEFSMFTYCDGQTIERVMEEES